MSVGSNVDLAFKLSRGLSDLRSFTATEALKARPYNRATPKKENKQSAYFD
ncbi:hypothetical protein NTG1052_520041 [Candidatus Nitrotoga sp. 1052]|nr:hypothetical protein NTG1052_520041 [Candidatus Nitrotoga sp. 1052]